MPKFIVRIRRPGTVGPAGFSPLTDIVVRADSASKAAARGRQLKWGSHPKNGYVTECTRVELKLITWRNRGRAGCTQSHATLDGHTTLCGRSANTDTSYTDTTDCGVSCKKCQTSIDVIEAAS